jgi:hypothetical protein
MATRPCLSKRLVTGKRWSWNVPSSRLALTLELPCAWERGLTRCLHCHLASQRELCASLALFTVKQAPQSRPARFCAMVPCIESSSVRLRPRVMKSSTVGRNLRSHHLHILARAKKGREGVLNVPTPCRQSRPVVVASASSCEPRCQGGLPPKISLNAAFWPSWRRSSSASQERTSSRWRIDPCEGSRYLPIGRFLA